MFGQTVAPIRCSVRCISRSSELAQYGWNGTSSPSGESQLRVECDWGPRPPPEFLLRPPRLGATVAPMKDDPGDERRGAQRFSMQLPVEVSAPTPTGPVAASTRTRDVSFRGVYFTFDRDLQINSPIDIVLTLPKEITMSNDVRVHCVGRVVRVEREDSVRSGQVGVAAVIERYNFLPPASEATTS